MFLTAPGIWAASEIGEAQGPRHIDTRQLVHWIVATNANVIDQGFAQEAATHRVQAEKDLYRPVWTSGISTEHEQRRRSSSEYSSFLASAETEADETTNSLETGLTLLLPTGGDASLNYSYFDLESNLIDDNPEYNYRLELMLKQPLLRGLGRGVTETGKRIAILEEDAAKMACRQQLMETSGEAAQLYWQLYRAYEVLAIRKAALDNANKLLLDRQSLVSKGRAPRAELLETRATIADRKSELARAEQIMTQVLTEIRISLNANKATLDDFRLEPVQPPDFKSLEHIGINERKDYALSHHPEYRLMEIRQQLAMERFEYADHMKRLKLDFEVGCSFDGLDPDRSNAFHDSMSSEYMDWQAGLFLEVPLGGNIRAKSEALAQKALLDQAKHRCVALGNRLANDIEGRWDQLQRAYEEVREVEASVGLHKELLSVEQNLFKHGRTRLRDVIEREILLDNARQRFVETAARVEIARIALMMADGRLLEEYGIFLE
ncbi:hypothetical protein DSCO28_34480 [Desulfosarcina ovata subsp. sediminis]|uniref:Transporter n=1 Tax=Desulfosarcina ovata subsp. sediminis TaxID=885957 RepID=A0A5K7ZL31_9BACT|nr:TolC family protein [Desulfosarcina ovata]BBO82882.1 hypothetical protein DSCO28_34480 [Desulfosarcina ovata subsp. sediminis]